MAKIAKNNSAIKPTMPKGERILITGVLSGFAKTLIKHLASKNTIIGVDYRPYQNTLKGVEFHRLKLEKSSSRAILRKEKPTIIIHLGVNRNPKSFESRRSAFVNLEATSELLKLAEEAKVKKFIFLSTGNLYGPSATTFGFLSEDAPLHGSSRSLQVRNLAAMDMMIQSFMYKKPDIDTVIFRPVHMVGPQLQNAPTQYFRLKIMPTLLGYDPMIQIISDADVAEAFLLALTQDVRGVFNLVGDSQAPLSRLISSVGGKALPLPELMLSTFLLSMFHYNLTTFPPGEIHHLKYSCLLDGTKAKKQLGFVPKLSILRTLQTLR
jgi:UDP-glucose 4-epimerase